MNKKRPYFGVNSYARNSSWSAINFGRELLISLRASSQLRSKSMPTKQFIHASEQAKALTGSPSKDELLLMYGLFKQVNFGPNTTSAPGIWKMKARAKWGAWKKHGNMTAEEAEVQYIWAPHAGGGAKFRELDVGRPA